MNRAMAMALASTVAGCLAGDRASDGDCPEGETCSDTTPEGLYFRGTTVAGQLFSGLGPELTAVGGTQIIGIEDEDGNPFTEPFDATADGAFAIGGIAGNQVTVEGVAAGEGYLRIAEPGTRLLYDRKLIGAQPLDTVEIAAAVVETTSGMPVAFLPGDPAVAVALYAAPDTANGGLRRRLVDTSMTLDPGGGTQTAWDTVTLTDAVPGIYPIAVTAAGRPTTTLEALVVAGPTSLVVQPGQPTQLVVETQQLICFTPLADGKHVIGLDWTYSVDTGEVLPFANCGMVKAFTTGLLTLTATAGGVSTSVSFDVVPASPGARATPRPSPGSPVAPGERAARQ